MKLPWLQSLKKLVEEKPLVIIRFNQNEWESLHDSRRGVHEFTIARSHYLLEGVRAPAPCLIVGTDINTFSRDPEPGAKYLHFGLISSRSAITTLESRMKIRRSVQILPDSEAGLLDLVSEKPYAKNLADRLRSKAYIVQLSPKLGSRVIERLGSIKENHGAMRAVAESLSSPKNFRNAAALQEDALRTALQAFGLTPYDRALSLELVEGRETALARVSIMEDSVVEHDARHFPGYDLVESHLTGHAVFKRSDEHLEIFTANRRDLEHVFGVDLIYLNVRRQNIVMLQYKMLEPLRKDGQTDWIYRPDVKLDDEIRRMRKFATKHPAGAHEYRLNPAVFYLKFVKRDGLIRSGGIITPIDHYELLRTDPACKGPKNGLRISYEGLAGRYLRQSAFLDLIRSGYIGAHAETTQHLKTLVKAVLNSNRAVVAAIHSGESTDDSPPGDDDGRRNH
jgi:hypothetical protein